MSAGWAGLTITYAMNVTETFNYVLINFSQAQLHPVCVTKFQNILLLIFTAYFHPQLEENAVSIERIRETEKFAPRERDWRNPDEDPEGERKDLRRNSLNLYKPL